MKEAKLRMVAINKLVKRPPFNLLLALPVLFYLAVAALWQSWDINTITGDELHYLLVTDSLVRDHDVVVLNNYFIDTPVQKETETKLSEPTGLAHTINGFSTHGIGLPFVLLVPYYVAEVTGTKIFMALLAGLWPFLLYRVLYQIIESKPWSVLVAFTIACGLPFLAASNQIFPDLLGGMIILYVAERIVRILRGKHEKIPALSSFVVGVLISFLPWLHTRLSVPAVVLLLGYIYAVVTAGSGQVRRPRRHWWLVPTATFALSSVLLCYYNYIAFENAFGLFGGTHLNFEIKKIGMLFLGLHWDQSQGMFMQQPLLLLGLVGVVPLIKANWRVALLIGTLYLSTLSLVSMCPNCQYGSWSLAGRFGWDVVSLWVFPAAYAVKLLLERSKVIVLLLCISSIFLQALLASKWLLQDRLLYNSDFDRPIWASASLYTILLNPELWLRLPFFKEFDNYLSHPPNYVFVVFGLLLVISGWLWQRGATRLVGAIWTISLIAGISIIALVPPPLNPLTVHAYKLMGQTVIVDGSIRVATEQETEEGLLTHGPYVALPAGSYEATLEYEWSSTPGLPMARWDIVSGQRLIADGDLPPSTANNGTFSHEFSVSEALPPLQNWALQFRVWYPGHGSLRVERLTITPLEIASE